MTFNGHLLIFSIMMTQLHTIIYQPKNLNLRLRYNYSDVITFKCTYKLNKNKKIIKVE